MLVGRASRYVLCWCSCEPGLARPTESSAVCVCVCLHLCACVLVQGCVTSRVAFGCELRYPCWRCWFEQEAYELLQLWPNMTGDLLRSHETRLDNWSMLAMALARSAPPNLTWEILQRTVPSVFVHSRCILTQSSQLNSYRIPNKFSLNSYQLIDTLSEPYTVRLR